MESIILQYASLLAVEAVRRFWTPNQKLYAVSLLTSTDFWTTFSIFLTTFSSSLLILTSTPQAYHSHRSFLRTCFSFQRENLRASHLSRVFRFYSSLHFFPALRESTAQSVKLSPSRELQQTPAAALLGYLSQRKVEDGYSILVRKLFHSASDQLLQQPDCASNLHSRLYQIRHIALIFTSSSHSASFKSIDCFGGL